MDKRIDPPSDSFKPQWSEDVKKAACAPSSRELGHRAKAYVRQILRALNESTDSEFAPIEKQLIASIAALGRVLVAYFLARSQERRSRNLQREFRKKGFARRRVQSRTVATWFGKVQFWRTYMTQGNGGGVCPLDRALGLTADAFSRSVVGIAARLATIVSYDRVTGLLLQFLAWSPSKTSVEHAVLGLGRYGEEWFAAKPAPIDDGDVLVVQIDGKAIPTATDGELRKRRSARKPTQFPDSPRHRGREARLRRGKRPRRKKGDKSKNGKVATVVVMYTLKTTITDEGELVRLGPINKEVYAAHRGRRHAFEVARREADKRGFGVGSGKTVQVLCDGDRVLQQYAEELFPDAVHTLDVFHALQYVWKAGCCLHEEGSDELELWYELVAKDLVYDGKVARLLEILDKELEKIPKTGPGNKGKRKRLAEAISYLEARVERMNYDWLDREDLELATGSVEGAVRYVVGERFDCAGMRWIKQRAERLLQLRCIELNGHWEEFTDFAYRRLLDETSESEQPPSMLLNARCLREAA